MARIKIEKVVEKLDREFKKALDDTMQEFAPDASYDQSALFRFFLRRVYQHCSTWETIPDSAVNVT